MTAPEPDFVVGEPLPADPDSGEPGGSGGWGRRILLLAAVAILGVAVLAFVRHGSPPPAPTPHAAASTSPVVPTPSSRPPTGPTAQDGPAGVQLEDSFDPPPCPPGGDGQSACATVRTVPDLVRAAVVARFPHARSMSVVTQALRDTGPGSEPGLWSRTLTARVAGGRLLIVVNRTDGAAPSEMSLSAQDASRLSLWCTEVQSGYAVRIRLVVPATVSVPLSRIVRLALDRRMLAGG